PLGNTFLLRFGLMMSTLLLASYLVAWGLGRGLVGPVRGRGRVAHLPTDDLFLRTNSPTPRTIASSQSRAVWRYPQRNRPNPERHPDPASRRLLQRRLQQRQAH